MSVSFQRNLVSAAQPLSWHRAPRGLLPAIFTAFTGAALVHLLPTFEFQVLARGAAGLTALLCGSPVLALDEGFALPAAHVPVIVTRGCSAADFFCMVATLVSWHVARRTRSPWATLPVGLVAAVPLTIFVNALRISTVALAHRWIIPQFPEAYASFLHLTTGAAVFLPSLIALQFLFDTHARRSAATRH
jgi:exosortase/archaeosortase family protein